MAELVLSERAPLAHAVAAGSHGAHPGEGGLLLAVKRGLGVFAVLATRSRLEELGQTLHALRLPLPGPGQFASHGGCRLLWSGPEQWIVVGVPAEAEQLAHACAGHGLVVDQSDARAVVAVSGPRARATLAKGVPLDLHARVFQPGMTAVTAVAGIPVQIWQADDAPTYELAVPRSFIEDFWAWLTHAAAEYGYDVSEHDEHARGSSSQGEVR